MNKAQIIGNLGRDPETRQTNNGRPVCTFSVATSEKWKDRDTGEKREQTEWHRIVIFGPLAEIAGKYLKKGSKVYLEGKLTTRKWTDNNGVERYTTEIVLSGPQASMEMLGSRGEGGGGGGHADSPYDRDYGGGGGQAQQGGAEDLDDEIPF